MQVLIENDVRIVHMMLLTGWGYEGQPMFHEFRGSLGSAETNVRRQTQNIMDAAQSGQHGVEICSDFM